MFNPPRHDTEPKAAERHSLLSRIFGHKESLQPAEPKKAIYLVGEPGYPNFGDELIANEWLSYLSELCPKTPVYLDCTRPGPAAAILRNAHPSLRVVDTISRLTFETPEEWLNGSRLTTIQSDAYDKGTVFSPTSEGPAEADATNPCKARRIASFIAHVFNDEGAAARYASGLHILLNEVSSVHYIGGGSMNEMWQENLARLSVGAELAKRGIPVFATGIGLTPLSGDSRDFALQCLSEFSFVTVRDESSLKALSPLPKVSLAPDDCFVNGLEKCTYEDADLPNYMVCVQGDLVSDEDALHYHVLSQLSTWHVNPETKIGVVECNPYIDFPIFNALKNAGYSPVLYPAAVLLERGMPVKPSQIWICTRYHPHLIASALGCSGSFIPLGNSFYEDKHRAVQRMGSHWTESRIGSPAGKPGHGFDNLSLINTYKNEIRSTVTCYSNRRD